MAKKDLKSGKAKAAKGSPERRKKRLGRMLLLFWMAIMAPFLGLALMLVMAGSGAFGPLPTFEELENPKSNEATVIYSADHEILGTYFSENRVNIRRSDLSEHLVTALIATEDERFRDHSGIDLIALGRSVKGLATGNMSQGGGSTITQQLAKMLFHEREVGFKRITQKFKEWIIAVRLEKRYTKDEILTMYLNRLDFVNNAVGVQSASLVYFDVDPIDLRIEQAAMLVGMAKNPSLFNPIKRHDTVLHRRNVVLSQMKRNNVIDTAQYDSLVQLPLGLDYQIVDHNEGLAPYFREQLRNDISGLLTKKDANGNLVYGRPDGTEYSVYRDGLKIYTTIDSRMQEYAEYAVYEHLGKELQPTFDKKLENKRNRPFSYKVKQEQIDKIMNEAKLRSPRYQVLSGQECGHCHRRGKYIDVQSDSIVCIADDCGHTIAVHTEAEIDTIFSTPVSMEVFNWRAGPKHNYEIDTIMSPIDSIRYYKGFFQAGMMSMDPHTGFVKAWVGGINHHHFKYDHVRQGKRQVGSTFKPFVYAAFIRDGHSPCEELANVPVMFEKEEWGLPKNWQPKNSGGEYGDMVTLKYALANSLNTISARIMHSYGPGAGPDNIIKLARKMGVTSDLPATPSLCLGVADLSVYEMVGANATFANKGVFIQPIILTRIEDRHGNVIYDVIPKSSEALDEVSAYVMLDLMKGVTQGAYNPSTGKSSGTGVRIRSKSRPYGGIKYPVAGKTGTTQNNSDGWFMGITPDLVTGVWVGAEDRSVHFDQTLYGQGANMALPIWGYYMNKVYDDSSIEISKGDFERPKTMGNILDCNQYINAGGPLEETLFSDEDEELF